MPTRTVVILTLLLLPILGAGLQAADPTTQANVMTELTFTAKVPHKDPFNDLTLDLLVTDPAHHTLRVPAFYAGNNTFKARYASPLTGSHTYTTDSSDPTDPGLHHVTGSITITPYTGNNPLYQHGPLTVSPSSRYIQHHDGTPFLWLGDTWWMGLTKRLSWPDEFQTLAKDRKEKGFNVIQIVAGLYPDMPPFDPRGDNETGQPWEGGYARIRPEYFDAADKKILYLVDQGFTPCIVSTWGYHLPFLGEERMKQHQRYVYARWAALPIVWAVAGEINMPYYLSPEFHQPFELQAARWRPVVAYCRSINCFDRLITAHPSGGTPSDSRSVLDAAKPADSAPTAKSLVDIDMLQTPHGQLEALAPTVQSVRFAYSQNPPMPVVHAEPSYEMLMDRTPAEIARLMFWVSWTNGVKGYTYGANGIWQVNGKDKPYGKSPHGGDYGHIPWQTAMNLPGSSQVSLGAKLLAELPWTHLEPHPNLTTYAPADLQLPLGDWIWFPEGKPTQDAPIAARYFRKSFDLPKDAKIRRASLQFTADDKCTAYLNGKELASNADWHALKQLDDLAPTLRPNGNTLAFRAENLKADNVTQNPASLICGLLIELEDNTRIEIKSDNTWLTSKSDAPNWNLPYFLDADWSQSLVTAHLGDAPWFNITGTSSDPYLVPYTLAIPRVARLIYVPVPRPILVKDLEPTIHYSAFYFDPVTGTHTPAPDLIPTAYGCRVPPPPTLNHDWLLVLKAPN